MLHYKQISHALRFSTPYITASICDNSQIQIQKARYSVLTA